MYHTIRAFDPSRLLFLKGGDFHPGQREVPAFLDLAFFIVQIMCYIYIYIYIYMYTYILCV